MWEFLAWSSLLILVVIAIFLWALILDDRRIKVYFASKKWRLLSKSLNLFGPGWLGQNNMRIYEVLYKDEIGNLHYVHLKTSMFGGVYFTDDLVLEYVDDQDVRKELLRLKKENRQLRAELKRIKRRN